jgi:hypothetical protein
MTRIEQRQLHSKSPARIGSANVRPAIQHDLAFTGLVVACAFGDIRRLRYWSSNPTTDQGTVSEPSKSQDKQSYDGSEGSSILPVAPEQKVSRPEAPNLYSERVEVEGAKRVGACHGMTRRYRVGRHFPLQRFVPTGASNVLGW